MSFGYLSNLANIEVPVEVVKRKATRVGIDRNPKEGADIRIVVTGAKVTPSADIINRYNLEFHPKGDALQGNGMDIVPGDEWTFFQEILDRHMSMQPVDAIRPETPLFVTFTPRKGDHTDKITLFGSCRCDDNGVPKSPVAESVSRGDEFIEAVLRILFKKNTEPVDYFDEIAHSQIAEESRNDLRAKAYSDAKSKLIDALVAECFIGGYVDIKIHSEEGVNFAADLIPIPKKVARGVRAGRATSTNRANQTYYPVSLVDPVVVPSETPLETPEPLVETPEVTPEATDVETMDVPNVETTVAPVEEAPTTFNPFG